MHKNDLEFTLLRKTMIKGIIRQFEMTALKLGESSDYAIIEKALTNIKTRSRMFYLVKKYVKSWGHWKELPRGKPRRFN
jgi:NH3-dependent NAD+ synthetase